MFRVASLRHPVFQGISASMNNYILILLVIFFYVFSILLSLNIAIDRV
ncbi:MAG: hypothetical protein ACI9YH_003700 [Colwellia sp.]|jgi:hypothetical protein